MGLAGKFFILLHEFSNSSSLQLQLRGKITSLGTAGFRNPSAFPLPRPDNRPNLGENYIRKRDPGIGVSGFRLEDCR
jgi:hypothetical protein